MELNNNLFGLAKDVEVKLPLRVWLIVADILDEIPLANPKAALEQPGGVKALAEVTQQIRKQAQGRG